MRRPAAFTIIQTLHEDETCVVYRGVRMGDGRHVIIKALGSRWQPRDLERLKKEYELGTRLDTPFVLRPLGLESYQGAPALVLEDFEGRSLAELRGAPLDRRRFLLVASRLAAALAAVHSRGVIHKDIKPENVILHPGTGEVRLIDLGLASLLSAEQQEVQAHRVIEGSLPYLSPEQTGRTSWPVDARTDLYSLGVTLYELCAGRLPFQADDPPGWIHGHLARVPSPLSEVQPGTPAVLSDIVAKLIAKAPEDRYRSALGLQFDLERCLASLTSEGRIEAFALGQGDVSERFQVPYGIRGREQETAEILAAFDRVAASGLPELVLVSGHAGIGKTSLVRELHKPIVRERGLFLSGKCDQYRRDMPYSTIAEALRALLLETMVESDERIKAWRDRLRNALGANGGLIVSVIPELELLMGPQPAVAELPLDEARNRLRVVFWQFLGVFARKEHPLALFLDDLQWSDAASLELLVDVLLHPDTRHLLAIGAYRSDEVTAGHPLMMALDGLRKSRLAVRELVLGPLSRDHLGQLVAGAMLRDPDDVAPLTALIGEKTAGNPFFAIQFLTALHEDGLIRLDSQELAWRCDIAAARARGYTSNVVDLMVSRLKRLPSQAQEAVKLAACVGDVADVATLSMLLARSEEETHRALWEPMREGLVNRSGDTYRFSHDRVRQAAHALFPEARSGEVHLRIGRLLLAHTADARLGDRVFDIASQLNRGATLIEDQEERYRLAEIDLLAGQRAKASAAHGPAAQYLAAGMAMLPADCWQARPELAYALHLERAQCEYLSGEFAEAERCLTVALLHARSNTEKAAVYRLRIEVCTTRGEAEKAVDGLVECAALFGLALERHPPSGCVEEQCARVTRSLDRKGIEELVDLPSIADPDVRALLEALVAASSAAYHYDKRLSLVVLCEAVRLSIQCGNAPCSAVAYALFGATIGPQLGDYRGGYRFGKLGLDLVERKGFLACRSRTSLLFWNCIAFWTEHVSNALSHLEEGLRVGLETGDLNFACYSCFAVITIRLARGDPLEDVEGQSKRMLEVVRNARYGEAEDSILAQRRLILRLRGLTPALGSAGALSVDEEKLEARIQSRNPLTRCFHCVRTLQERFLFGRYREALSAALQAKALSGTSTPTWEGCEYSYFLALTLSSLHAEAAPREQEEYLRTLGAEAERHRVWAENCPENFANRHALLCAEIARLTSDDAAAMRLYEQAIRSARESGFLPNEAIASELAARFYDEQGMEIVAHTYLRQARSCYARWGAMGKVQDLDQRHPELFEPRPAAPPATYLARQEQLDLLSVAKASQSISREIVLDELVRTLVRIAIEQGGARKGSLILARDGKLSIEAQARLEPQRIEVELVGSPLSDRSLVPLSVIQYAARTHERVVLGAAPEIPFAADEYLARVRPMSVLCLPLVRQAEVAGLLYLENDLVAGVFTPERLMALELLATQAAISLENASLLAKEQAARAAAEAAESRSAFLAEAGALLSESLDYSRTLAGIARLCVRSMADWCVIDVLEGREIRRVGGAHADPGKEPLLRELRQRYPPRPDSPGPAVMVLRTGEPLLISSLTDDEIRRRFQDEEHAQLIRELGTRTAIAVPLVARGQTLGVISFYSASPERRYGPVDLELAQELARRAALAIDNARLYRDALGLAEAERLRAEAEAANRALQQQARALEAGKLAREEVLAVVSHDLRGPLSAILTSSKTLEKVAPGGAGAEAARLITRSATRLTRLASDLLDFSAIEAGRLSVVRAPHEAVSLAREAVETLQEMAQDHGVRLATDSVPAGLTIECDRDRIIQVLSNLLANAIHVSPKGGTVALSVATDQGQAVFSVKDAGPGISPEELPRLFDRYSRGRSASYKGTGLGLAIARRLVELHGGEIWAESAPGCGSTFRFRLPAASLGVRSEILIVDDDADIRSSLKAVLEIEGYGVALASNGFEAWELLQSAPLPALVLLDLMMPVMNGAELLGRVRADDRLQSVPVVLVTACESLAQPVAAKSQGSLPKPFDPRHVIELASRYCTPRPH
ncbi:MAG: hypothetical protein A2V77_24585 [Anaeromyxobacter sp. RBG_16_69_14]|nr:MAG: hypothetical protein A2V77_24585 [Anaeromyxobacter sp. RBG_16_69_14]